MHTALLLLVGIAATARADADATVKLETTAPPCALDDAIAGTRRLIGYDAFDGKARRKLALSFSTTGGLVVEIRIIDPDGTVFGPRTLTATTCDLLQAPLAVVLATMVRSLPEDGSPFVDRDLVDGPDRREPDAIAHGRRTASDIALGAGSVGSSDGVSAEISLAVRMRRDHRSLTLTARHEFPGEHSLNRGVLETSRVAIEPVVCGHAGPLGMCGLVSVGWINAKAMGLAATEPERLFVMGLGTRLELEKRLPGGLGLRAHVDLRVAAVRPRLLVDGMPEWTAPAVEAAVGIALVAHIQ